MKFTRLERRVMDGMTEPLLSAGCCCFRRWRTTRDLSGFRLHDTTRFMPGFRSTWRTGLL